MSKNNSRWVRIALWGVGLIAGSIVFLYATFVPRPEYNTHVEDSKDMQREIRDDVKELLRRSDGSQ